MKTSDLAMLCVERLNNNRLPDVAFEEVTVMLVTPKGWKHPPKFPRGKLATVNAKEERVWWFKAVNVLAWLAANGMVDLKL